MMPKKKPYYPNNWKAISAAPAEWFGDIPFDEFMDWKIAGWELPSSVSCIIREENLETGKIKEYVYQRTTAAKAKTRAMMREGISEFTVVSHDAVHFMTPEQVPPYDDPLA
tara:strand:- start:513 stop:845 length:333 start_codon:yes stop_codon:yes gene_type:complete